MLGVVTLLCIFVTVNIAIRTFQYAPQAFRSDILKLSFKPFYYIISVMNILLSLEFLADGLKYFGQSGAAFKNRHNKPEQKEGEA